MELLTVDGLIAKLQEMRTKYPSALLVAVEGHGGFYQMMTTEGVNLKQLATVVDRPFQGPLKEVVAPLGVGVIVIGTE